MLCNVFGIVLHGAKNNKKTPRRPAARRAQVSIIKKVFYHD